MDSGMADVTTFTFQVDEELKAAFSKATEAHDISGADVLRDFMRGYVEQHETGSDYEVWFRRKVQKAIDAANAGDMVSGDEVEAEFAALRDAARKSSAR